jgi:hypothetical protein
VAALPGECSSAAEFESDVVRYSLAPPACGKIAATWRIGNVDNQ